MKNKVFLFVAIILIGIGILVFFVSGNANITVNGTNVNSMPGEKQLMFENIVKYGVSGLLAGLGLLFLILGFAGSAKESKQRSQMNEILMTGIQGEATVTFVDKNYTLLINNKPIYSIVEYVYQDKNGAQHTRKIHNMNSDLVIRNKIEVGSKIKIKYSQSDYSQSVMFFD